MSATWNAQNTGSGSGQFALAAGNTTPYQNVSDAFSTAGNSMSYSASEVVDGTVVGSACSTDNSGVPQFTLAGYTTGDTLLAAASATPSMTAPVLSNFNASTFVIVWNTKCPPSQQQNNPTTAVVHVMKYLNGAEATTTSANSTLFPMTETFTAHGGTQTTTTFSLGNGTIANHAYEYDTSPIDAPAVYTTSEVTGSGSTDVLAAGAACVEGQYRLSGYKTSAVSFADAANSTLVTSAPNFATLSADEYVIVYNTLCGSTSGEISGDVGSTPLAVTSVTTVKGNATADGTFANGWKYVFNITVPTNETHLAMKFANWLNNPNQSQTIQVANNMRISSAQADNNNATVMVTAANTYTSPALHMTGDLDANTPGMQVQVTVEVAIPSGTANGSYTTSYGVQSLP